MLFAPLIAIVLAGIQSTVTVAQDATVLNAIISDLNKMGATSMAALIQAADITVQLPLTTSSPRTLWVPSNEALQNFNASNPDLSSMLLYHLTTGGLWTVGTLGTIANHSILSTSLVGSHTALEGNRPAVIACGNPKGDGNIEVYNQAATTLVSNSTQNNQINIAYHVVDRIIDYPPDYVDAVSAFGATWHSTAIAGGYTDDIINGQMGGTFFVFTDQAYQNDLNAHLSNESAKSIIANHVILGKTAWYPNFANETLTTLSGNQLTFTVDPETFEYTVSIGQSSAHITRSDLTLVNGVMHILDGTLWDLNSSTTNATSNSTVGLTSSVPAPTQTQASDTQGSTKSALSGGAIAGMVIGVLALILLAILAAFLFRRRQRVLYEQAPMAQTEATPFVWGQPVPYTSPSVTASDMRDDAVTLSSTSPSASLAPARQGGKQPLVLSGTPREQTRPDSPPSVTGGAAISDQVVDHLLERLAARIDPNPSTGIPGVDPPMYRYDGQP